MNDSSSAIAAPPDVDDDTESRRAPEPVYRLREDAGARQQLPRAVQRLVGQLDGRRPLGEACRRAAIDRRRARAAVQKLLSLGVLVEVAPGQEPRPGPQSRGGFSDSEMAFFATEVAPIDECDLPFETVGRRLRRLLGRLGRR